MKILAIAPDIPFPPIGGAQTRTYYLLKSLAEHHDLTLLGFAGDRVTSPADFSVRVFEVPWDWPERYKAMRSDDPEASRRAYQALTDPMGEPWFVSCYQVTEMEEKIRNVVKAGFDVVLIEHTAMARFLHCLPAKLPKILDFVDVHSLIASRALNEKTEQDRQIALLEAQRTRRFESDAGLQCDLCLAVSEPEADAARSLLGLERVAIVPNGVETQWFAPCDQAPMADQMLFTGQMSYAPNVEAVVYFAREILPRIVRESPTAQLHIVGNNPAPEVHALAGAHGVVHGFVPDTRPFYRKAKVVVVPLLHGGGTRLKILEAAASGKAIVTTSLGVEGLLLEDGRDLIVADVPEQFADAVVNIMRDDRLRSRLGKSARTASLAYDWQIIGERFRSIVESVA